MVALADGTPWPAKLVGLDPGSGIALLKIEAADLRPIEIGDMADVAVGDIVLAIGNPPGVGQTVSHGIIGAIGRTGTRSPGTSRPMRRSRPVDTGAHSSTPRAG